MDDESNKEDKEDWAALTAEGDRLNFETKAWSLLETTIQTALDDVLLDPLSTRSPGNTTFHVTDHTGKLTTLRLTHDLLNARLDDLAAYAAATLRSPVVPLFAIRQWRRSVQDVFEFCASAASLPRQFPGRVGAVAARMERATGEFRRWIEEGDEWVAAHEFVVEIKAPEPEEDLERDFVVPQPERIARVRSVATPDRAEETESQALRGLLLWVFQAILILFALWLCLALAPVLVLLSLFLG